MNLTPWYPPHIKPVRVGVYETDSINIKSYQYWNGVRWGLIEPTPQKAAQWIYISSNFKSPRWRGLAHPPKQSAQGLDWRGRMR